MVQNIPNAWLDPLVHYIEMYLDIMGKKPKCKTFKQNNKTIERPKIRI